MLPAASLDDPSIAAALAVAPALGIRQLSGQADLHSLLAYATWAPGLAGASAAGQDHAGFPTEQVLP